MNVWDVSIWWVLLAAVVYFVIGALYYSPKAFGPQWSKELGKKPGDMGDMKTAMITSFLTMLLLVVVETYFVHATGTTGWWRGALLGVKLWLGFVLTTALINSAYQGSSKKLLAMDQGYHFLGIVLAGAILGFYAK